MYLFMSAERILACSTGALILTRRGGDSISPLLDQWAARLEGCFCYSALFSLSLSCIRLAYSRPVRCLLPYMASWHNSFYPVCALCSSHSGSRWRARRAHSQCPPLPPPTPRICTSRRDATRQIKALSRCGWLFVDRILFVFCVRSAFWSCCRDSFLRAPIQL
jgi:hypothetical protein